MNVLYLLKQEDQQAVGLVQQVRGENHVKNDMSEPPITSHSVNTHKMQSQRERELRHTLMSPLGPSCGSCIVPNKPPLQPAARLCCGTDTSKMGLNRAIIINILLWYYDIIMFFIFVACGNLISESAVATIKIMEYLEWKRVY